MSNNHGNIPSGNEKTKKRDKSRGSKTTSAKPALIPVDESSETNSALAGDRFYIAAADMDESNFDSIMTAEKKSSNYDSLGNFTKAAKDNSACHDKTSQESVIAIQVSDDDRSAATSERLEHKLKSKPYSPSKENLSAELTMTAVDTVSLPQFTVFDNQGFVRASIFTILDKPEETVSTNIDVSANFVDIEASAEDPNNFSLEIYDKLLPKGRSKSSKKLESDLPVSGNSSTLQSEHVDNHKALSPKSSRKATKGSRQDSGKIAQENDENSKNSKQKKKKIFVADGMNFDEVDVPTSTKRFNKKSKPSTATKMVHSDKQPNSVLADDNDSRSRMMSEKEHLEVEATVDNSRAVVDSDSVLKLLDQVERQTRMSASRLSLETRCERDLLESPRPTKGSLSKLPDSEKSHDADTSPKSPKKKKKTRSPTVQSVDDGIPTPIRPGTLNREVSKNSLDLHSLSNSARESMYAFDDANIGIESGALENTTHSNTVANSRLALKSRSKSKSKKTDDCLSSVNPTTKDTAEFDSKNVSRIIGEIQSEIETLEAATRSTMALNELDADPIVSKNVKNKPQRDSIQSLVDRIEKETSGQTNDVIPAEETSAESIDGRMKPSSVEQEVPSKYLKEKTQESWISVGANKQADKKLSSEPTRTLSKANCDTATFEDVVAENDTDSTAKFSKYQSAPLAANREKLQELIALVNTPAVTPYYYDSKLDVFFSQEYAAGRINGGESNAEEILFNLFPLRGRVPSTRPLESLFIQTPFELEEVEPVLYDRQADIVWRDDMLVEEKQRLFNASQPLGVPRLDTQEVQAVLYDKELRIFFLKDNENEFVGSGDDAVVLDGKVLYDPKVSYSRYLERQYPQRQRMDILPPPKMDQLKKVSLPPPILKRPPQQRPVRRKEAAVPTTTKPVFRTGLARPSAPKPLAGKTLTKKTVSQRMNKSLVQLYEEYQAASRQATERIPRAARFARGDAFFYR